MIRLLPLFEKQVHAIARPRPTVIFPEADDPRILGAASRVSGILNVVLLTTRERARQRIADQGVQIHGSLKRFLGSVHFLTPDQVPDLCQEFHDRFFEASHGKRWAVPYEVAGRLVREPVIFSCMAVRLGYADSVLGGVVLPSRDFFRPALRLLHGRTAAFETGLFSLPDDHPANIYQENLVAFADVAINPEPAPCALAQIAVGTCKIVRDLIPVDVLPHVNGAILSYSTRGSAEGESVYRIRKAGELIPGMLRELEDQDPLYGTIRIEAELQISCAISIAAAQSKLRQALDDPGSPVGRSNVLVVSTLDAGNLLYHLYATRYPTADRVLLVGGMDSRVLDFSRSSTTDDVVLGAMATALRIKRNPSWEGTPKDQLCPRYRVLVINPGSTSTRLAAFEGEKSLFEEEARHSADELATCGRVADQLELRMQVVRDTLARQHLDLGSLHAIVGRGGLVRPVVSGTWRVNGAMLEDLRDPPLGDHASNLGAPIAHALAETVGKPAFIVDPVVVDELDPASQVLGVKGFRRRAIWHALSQKAVAKRYADRVLKDYEDLNLIVAHLGGGITVGAHRKGRCFHVNDGLNEGPLTPERAGSVPHGVILDLCYERGLTRHEVERRLVGQGGLVGLLGTSNLIEVERRMDSGDPEATVAWEAMAEGIASDIAGAVIRFRGEPIDRILVTGGMARSERLVHRLETLLAQIPVGITVYAGEHEAEAMRDGAIRALRGQEEIREYPGPPT